MADKFVNENNAKTLLNKVKTYTDQGLANKQDGLTETQLNAVNSGVDSSKVAQIATNTANITSLQSQIGDIGTLLDTINGETI